MSITIIIIAGLILVLNAFSVSFASGELVVRIVFRYALDSLLMIWVRQTQMNILVASHSQFENFIFQNQNLVIAIGYTCSKHVR